MIFQICPWYMKTDMTRNDENGIDPMISARKVADLYEKSPLEIGGKFFRLGDLIDPFNDDFKRTEFSGLKSE